MGRIYKLVPLAICIFLACENEEYDKADNTIDFNHETSENIGSEGGSIEIEDFVLTIPSGAFNNNTEIVLSSAVDNKTFGEILVSRLFKIDGIPSGYNKPLRVKIKYEEALNEESYIALGEEVFVSSLDSIINAFNLINAEDSSGWLLAELPIPDNERKSTEFYAKSLNEESSTNFILGSISYIRGVYSSGEHFYIRYPMLTVDRSDAIALGEYLEHAYETFHNYGFDYTKRSNWPVDVFVKPFLDDVYGFYTSSQFGDDYGFLEFNQNEMKNSDMLKTTAGHEFFHLVQYLYDFRSSWDKAGYPSDHHWFNEASAVWSEKLFTEDPGNYLSTTVANLQMAPFNGFHAGSVGNPIKHGYGMLGVINYLTDLYGEGFVLKVFQSLNSGMHVMDAISLHTEDPVYWLDNFFKQYVLGNLNVYGVDESFFLTNRHREFIINNKSNFNELITEIYPDLSAKLYTIVFKDNSIDDNWKISLDIEGVHKDFAEITVFRWVRGADSRIEFVAHATDQITIGKIKSDYLDNMNRMLVLVTNAYTSDSYQDITSYNLNFKMVEAPPSPDYNSCGAMVKVYGYYHEFTPTSSRDYESDNGAIQTNDKYTGIFTENTFTANYSSTVVTVTHSGSLTAIFNETHDVIESLEWEEETTGSNFKQVKSFKLTNIPKSYNGIFQVEGETSCDHITSLSSVQTSPSGLNYTLEDFICTSKSKVYISFTKE